MRTVKSFQQKIAISKFNLESFFAEKSSKKVFCENFLKITFFKLKVENLRVEMEREIV
jgi:hypothetical protein